MHFIFGGRFMGKRAYAETLAPGASVCDLSACDPRDMFSADILTNVHLLVKRLIREGDGPEDFFRANMDRLAGKILIGDEVGSGVVPVEASEREWRDEVGRVYQLLGAHADRVTRMWAGIPQELKGSGAPL